MELLKPEQEPLKLIIGDVTFHVRSNLTARDKLAMDMIGEYVNGVFVLDKVSLFEKLIELFVVGWEGVTENGKPVPYSFKTFMTRFPGDVAQDWLLRLGGFIMDSLGLVKKADVESALVTSKNA